MKYRLSLQLKNETSKNSTWLTPLLAVIMAFALGAVFLLAYGYDPISVYTSMLQGAFGSFYGFSETLVKAIPIAICSLAVAIAFRMQLWNIGAEGQLYMGAFAASWVALNMHDLPAAIIIILMFLVAAAAGGVWGAIPGSLKAYLGANETITTLMLNYVAILWVDFLVYGPWKDPKGYNFPLTPVFPKDAWLPILFGNRVHIGLILVLVLAMVLYLLIEKTAWGYRIRVIGHSQLAARYGGMNVKRTIIMAMFISGAIAGVAGMVEASGITHRLQHTMSPGYGYTAIIIAWLSGLNALAILPVSFLFGALLVGGYSVQSSGIPFAIVSMLQGALLFFLVGGEVFSRYRIRLIKRGSN
ncbi:MAG: ABC transporter permease [Methylocystaceae bacterium]